MLLLVLGYRIASNSISDYPIHKSIRERTFNSLLDIQDESTQASLQTFIEDCDMNGETPLFLATRKL